MPGGPQVLWHLVDDRGTYRPGETYRAKGWVGPCPRIANCRRGTATASTTWPSTRSASRSPAAASTVQPTGSFVVEFPIPAGAGTGGGWISLAADSPSAAQHPLVLAEYRRPDFEVTTSAGAGPHTRVEPITVTARAEYYTGGALADAPRDLAGHDECGDVPPAGLGALRLRSVVAVVARGRRARGRRRRRSGRRRAAASSRRRSRRTPAAPTPPAATRSSCGSARSTRTSRACPSRCGPTPPSRTSTARRSPERRTCSSTRRDLYVGLGAATTFVRQGKTLTIDVIVTDIDGSRRRRPRHRGGRRAARTVDSSAASGPRRSSTPRRARVTSRSRAGALRLRHHRPAAPTGSPRPSPTTPVGSAGPRRPAGSAAPRRSRAAPSSARTSTSCRTPPSTSPATRPRCSCRRRSRRAPGWCVTDRGPIRSTATFDVVDGSAVVQIPVDDGRRPGHRRGGRGRRLGTAARPPTARRSPARPDRPAFATGPITLPISTAGRTLDVTTTPPTTAGTRRGDHARRRGSPTPTARRSPAPTARRGRRRGGARPERVPAGRSARRRSTPHLPTDVAATYRARRHRARRSARRLGSAARVGGDAATEAHGDGRGAAPRADDDELAGEADRAPTASAGGSAAAPAGPADRRPQQLRRPRRCSPPTSRPMPTANATVDVDAARQPHPLPRDGRRRRRRRAVRHGRGQRHRRAAADGPADRRRASSTSATASSCRSSCRTRPTRRSTSTSSSSRPTSAPTPARRRAGHGAGQRPGRGPLPGRRRRGRHRRAPGRGRRAASVADAATVSLPVYTPATTEAFATYGVIDDGADRPAGAGADATSSRSSAGSRSRPRRPRCRR